MPGADRGDRPHRLSRRRRERRARPRSRRRSFCAAAIVRAVGVRAASGHAPARRPTASSGTSRTRRRGRRTAAASRPAAAPIRSTASAISSSACAPPAARRSCRTQYLTGFGLAHDGGERFDSITPVLHGDVLVARALFAPKDADYLRYVDSYTNTRQRRPRRSTSPGAARRAPSKTAAWSTVAASSNGDRDDRSRRHLRHGHAEREAAWPIRRAGRRAMGRRRTCSARTPPALLTGVGDMYADPFTSRWPGYDPAHIGYVFTLTRASRGRPSR